jgi:hypothetical protein
MRTGRKRLDLLDVRSPEPREFAQFIKPSAGYSLLLLACLEVEQILIRIVGVPAGKSSHEGGFSTPLRPLQDQDCVVFTAGVPSAANYTD